MMATIKAKTKKSELRFDDAEMVRRAMAAWFRTGGPNAPIPANTSSVEEHDGKFYVELHNVNGTLAVYRIRNDGILKRMKRWPLEVEQTLEAARELERRDAQKAKRKGGH